MSAPQHACAKSCVRRAVCASVCEVCERARFWCIAFTPASKLALTTSIILAEVGITSTSWLRDVSDVAGTVTRLRQERAVHCKREALKLNAAKNSSGAASHVTTHGVLLASAAESR